MSSPVASASSSELALAATVPAESLAAAANENLTILFIVVDFSLPKSIS
uniref:Uncharacterized protein n=1 Tax=Setaria italica TaxID=4555 RepID=K4AP20_SETIT